MPVPSEPAAIALIPARSGSVRVPGKNVRPLAGHPLLAYAVRAALASGCFRDVVVSTDDPGYAAIARHYGAEVPGLRPPEMATALSPDIAWITDLLDRLRAAGRTYDIFAILRPTSPFRGPATIRRGFAAFRDEPGVDSLRAVEPVSQHPGKMWVIRGRRMTPLLPFALADGTPWHSNQMAALPPIHVQNASLEIAWTRVVLEGGTIAGDSQMPFLTDAVEGFDINTEADWRQAEAMADGDPSILPAVDVEPFDGISLDGAPQAGEPLP